MAPKSVTFRRHDHLVSVLFGDLLSHSYNITFSMFLDLVYVTFHYNIVKTFTRDVLASGNAELFTYEFGNDHSSHTYL